MSEMKFNIKWNIQKWFKNTKMKIYKYESNGKWQMKSKQQIEERKTAKWEMLERKMRNWRKEKNK